MDKLGFSSCSNDTQRTLLLAACTYLLWVAATYLLEGRILTLLRPDAVADRVIYTVVANILIGILLALWVIRHAMKTGLLTQESTGFGSLKRTVIGVIIGFLLGLGLLVVLHPASLHPVVLLNVYAQVLTVTVAEIAVCWAMMGALAEGGLKEKGKCVAILAGILVSSLLFGIYHVGHSPPFNQAGMILLLSLVGIATSLVYVIGRDIYATMAFHNFLGCIGVLQALDSAGTLPLYETPLAPVIAMAIISLAIFVAIDIQYIRKCQRVQGAG